ncbi:hypothetical protein EJ08DRAFT_690515 [Tothia fuscella]|uniref:EthD domain-containing protein n=1 Tax=Tothia fuscella TaxID=1048955 RepID=A0A9P4NFS9_9PEZI|nr:hypothetical protein EJ08DRAFT_690515 [Tothia fuscella]
MANPAIKGPGMLYVTSRISRKDILSEEVFMKWYDEDHIAEIVETDGIPSAYRYIDTDKNASKPYLAFYPMPDLAFTQGPEFKNFRVKSDILPGSGICFDLADIDVRYYGLTGESGTRKGEEHTSTQTQTPSNFEPSAGTTDEAVEEWYKSDHQEMISKLPGYHRSTYYKLLYARTNAQSRALKGLPTTEEAPPEPPTLQAIHEFDRVVQLDELKQMQETPAAKKILANAKQVEMVVYRWAKSHGDKKFFD